MKRKFFLRRAAIFFLTMLIPTLVLYALFLAVSVENASRTLADKGRQTVAAAVNNCAVIIGRTAQQNDLLTGTTRMNVSLRRALNEKEMTYGDSVYLTALGSMMRSTIDTTPSLESIIIWLDDAHRVFSSEGSSIQPLAQLKEQQWKDVYLQMPEEQRETLLRCTNEYGEERIVSIRRLLLQKGCTVVSIDAEKWAGELLTLLQRSPEYLYVFNQEKELLLHVTNAQDGTSYQDEALLQAEFGKWVKTDWGRYMMTLEKMDNLYVLAAVPNEAMTASLHMLEQTFFFILLVNIGVVMLLAYITTRRICNQMTLMIDMLDNALNGKPVERPVRRVHDEYDVIMNNILYMYLRDSALRTELQDKQYQQEHAELMALQLQINPHFLYNTLQSLDVTIRGGMADRFDICDIIRAISDILKYALSNPQEPVALRDEIRYLREYAAVQKFRFGVRFVLYYEVEDELLDCEVFRLMLQPLVENCMLHGLNGLSERGYIWVRAERAGEKLCISVKDNGAGMQPEELAALREHIQDANSRSIGLTNLNRRLLLRYGEASALQITSAPGEGTEVAFSISYIQVERGEVSFENLDDKK